MDFDKYKNTLPWQNINDHLKPLLAAIDEEKLTARERAAKIADARIAASKALESDRKAYRAAERAIEDQFWVDAWNAVQEDGLVPYVLTQTQKVRLQSWAWSGGHSDGFPEVFDHFQQYLCRLAELVAGGDKS